MGERQYTIQDGNMPDEEDDPYKFEEEELDRAREEAKKLEVERQRKASVSSSGVSDRSPLNHSFDSDRSPAAFSSEGERSPMTRSPHTPGFGAKQFSPVPEKSPSVPAYSPRYENALSKPFPSYDPEKAKYQANGAITVGFYQDMTDKPAGDSTEKQTTEPKPTESPVYSPTVPYMSSFYSSKADASKKQKSPASYASFYSSSDTTLEKAKTPNYYSASAPATPTDKPSPAPLTATEPAEKTKPQYSYYSYDPTKPLTDQYKSTGSVQPAQPQKKPPGYYNSHDGVKKQTPTLSPAAPTGPLTPTLASPVQVGLTTPAPPIQEKSEMQPLKKRAALDKGCQDFQNNSSVTAAAVSPVDSSAAQWAGRKSAEDSPVARNTAPPNVTVPFSPHPSALPANLANLSQIVSRITEPEANRPVPDKELSKSPAEPPRAPAAFPNPEPAIAKSLPPTPFAVAGGQTPTQVPVLDIERSGISAVNDLTDLHQQSLNLASRVQPAELARQIEADPRLQDRSMQPNYHQQITSPHMQTQPGLSSPQQITKPPQTPQSQIHSHSQPPIAHQKPSEGSRPSSRDLPPAHATEKSHMYLQQKSMWTSSLATSLANSLASSLPSSMVTSLATSLGSSLATTSVIASLQKMGSLQGDRLTQDRLTQERLAQLDRAALASLASRTGQANLFSHELLPRGSVAASQTQVGTGPSSGSSSGGGSSSGTPVSAGRSASGSSSGTGGSTPAATGNSVELGLSRSYTNMMTGQSSPLFGRGEGALTPGSLPRPLSGSSSPFLSQSPGLSALGLPGAPRTPTPAHQQSHQSLSSLSQGSFPSLPRDPRDPISQSHPSLQIPSLNSISSSQAQTLSHLNAANLASYSGRDSLALMNQQSRGALAGGLVDPTSQLYQQYLQQRQEELILRSAGAHPSHLAAHQSMMIQQGLMSAAGFSSGYPPSLGLRPGSYQGMNRPWL
ncbi:mucin-2-like [Penaeus indicus]|uniref:mucin-2-like n=1 Tax=Penaeus indicus TaxID=29960 RepID=UPI00300C53EF